MPVALLHSRRKGGLGMISVLLCVYVWQVDPVPLTAAGNAAVVKVYANTNPPAARVREGESLEVPIVVSRIYGEPNEGYAKVTVSLRYDGARLEYTGVRAGIPGALSKPIDIDRDGVSGTSTWRRVSVTWSSDVESMDLGELFTLLFKVRPIPDDVVTVDTSIGWDSAVVTDSAERTVKVDKRAPATITIVQERQVVLSADARGVLP